METTTIVTRVETTERGVDISSSEDEETREATMGEVIETSSENVEVITPDNPDDTAVTGGEEVDPAEIKRIRLLVPEDYPGPGSGKIKRPLVGPKREKKKHELHEALLSEETNVRREAFNKCLVNFKKAVEGLVDSDDDDDDADDYNIPHDTDATKSEVANVEVMKRVISGAARGTRRQQKLVDDGEVRFARLKIRRLRPDVIQRWTKRAATRTSKPNQIKTDMRKKLNKLVNLVINSVDRDQAREILENHSVDSIGSLLGSVIPSDAGSSVTSQTTASQVIKKAIGGPLLKRIIVHNKSSESVAMGIKKAPVAKPYIPAILKPVLATATPGAIPKADWKDLMDRMPRRASNTVVVVNKKKEEERKKLEEALKKLDESEDTEDFVIHPTGAIGLPDFCRICNKKFNSDIYLVHHVARKHQKPEMRRVKLHLKEDKVWLMEHPEETQEKLWNASNSFMILNKFKKIPGDECELVFNKDNHKCVCIVCRKILHEIRSARRHILAVHTVDDQKPWLCDVCNHSYADSKRLLNHRRVKHMEEAKFECPNCPEKFKTPCLLQKHIKYDHESSEQMCHICQKAFPTSVKLNTHVRNVHGEKRFKCDDCDKAYKTAAELRHHVDVAHINPQVPWYKKLDRPFKCDSCEDTDFTCQRALNDHMKIVHQGKRYPCDFCDMIFMNRSLKCNHVWKVHKGINRHTAKYRREYQQSKKKEKEQSHETPVSATTVTIATEEEDGSSLPSPVKKKGRPPIFIPSVAVNPIPLNALNTRRGRKPNASPSEVHTPQTRSSSTRGRKKCNTSQHHQHSGYPVSEASSTSETIDAVGSIDSHHQDRYNPQVYSTDYAVSYQASTSGIQQHPFNQYQTHVTHHVPHQHVPQMIQPTPTASSSSSVAHGVGVCKFCDVFVADLRWHYVDVHKIPDHKIQNG